MFAFALNTLKRAPLTLSWEFFKKSLNFMYSSFSSGRKFGGEGYLYARGIFIILLVDSLIVDDEPLWEPLEWSLVQTWLFFVFLFAWIGENLISSRFGSYVGRDKRVWFAWYKSFWLIAGWYEITFGVAALFIIVPFYYEITYHLSFVVSWWDWYTRVFFFKLMGLLSAVTLLAQLILVSNRVWGWAKMLVIVGIVNLVLAYMLYSHFITAFFAYFTDPIWYQKVRFVDAIQLSHEPSKWGWGGAKRDHFTYHKVSTSLWFKNDGPFASAMLLFQLSIFLILFFVNLYWLSLFRRIYTTGEVSYTFLTYCVSTLRQFTISMLFLYGLVLVSYLSNFWRFPIEFLFGTYSYSWFFHFFDLTITYFFFLTELL